MKSILHKTTLITFLLIVGISSLMAQSDKEQKAMDNFIRYYNQKLPDSLFSIFDAAMQEALPLETTREFIEGTYQQLGAVKEYEFSAYDAQQAKIAIFKTTFTVATLNVNMVVDTEGKISGLFLRPYIEESKVVLENALTDIPEEIANMIYEKAHMFPANTQLSIAVIQNGKTQYYGVIVENNSLKSTANQDKIFEIGSITKVFTSTVLADLTVSNKVQLEDKINPYFEFPLKDKAELRFVDLANHTSGLPRLPTNLDLAKVDPNNPYKDYGKTELEYYLQNEMQLTADTDMKYAYSNVGSGLLLYTLGLSQEKAFEDLLQKNVIDRYQMTNTYMNRDRLKNELVLGRDDNGQEISNWDFGVLFGAGGLLSSTSDMSKFVMAHFDQSNKELTLCRKPTYTINENMKIGLGLHILKLENGQEVFWHNGGTGGYSSSMAFDTTKQTGIVILSNVSAFNPYSKNIDELCFSLIQQLK